ncbi:hypothetical protein [Coprobacter fastidiosus]|uniref:hypothetical protein n=1 Tax=Coprobacter fastidiosus TaxID=1099853 RepID=UPI0026DB6CA0|nr:hypothetical protein [Coprobacter fastidiosus]
MPLIIYFFYNILKYGYKRTPGDVYVGLFLFFSIFSTVFTSGLMYLLFMQQYLLIWVIFYCFYHATWSSEDCDKFNRLFIWLAVSQIFAAILKYFIIGICEPYIGTMTSHSGGQTTLFSLIGFTVCAIFYFCTHKKSLLWGMLGFVLFGLIGEKRALVFLLPAALLISFSIYSAITRQFGMSFFKKILVGIIVLPLLFYVMVRVNPSFNPERKVWGAFDLEYTLSYVEKYNTGTLTKDKDNVGRSEAHAVFHEKILNDNLYHILFGYGTGLLIQSRFNPQLSQNENSTQGYSFRRWGIGYSISIGYLNILAQVGFVGVSLYFMIFISFLIDMHKGIMYMRDSVSISLGYGISAFVCILIMIFLSITYNRTGFIFSPVSVLLMWLISYSYKQLYSIEK